MCAVVGVEDDLTALAAAIPAPYGTVKNWHTRGRVPMDVVQKFARDRRVSLDTLLDEEKDQSELKKFSPSPLQVTSKASSASRKLEVQSERAHLLQQVVKEVLNSLDRAKLTLPNDKIAQLIELIYEYEVGNAAAGDESKVGETTERFLRLVSG
jgi:hypothetical protein